ncbi:MAG: hypothetical protein IH957_02300 [Chloroflexi bacterium]|nr:hypothetical protein [Chloroflexota bacterium]
MPRSIASALKMVRRDVLWLEDVFIFRNDTKEREWLQCVGQAGWLAISRDKKIISRPAERQTITDAKVGMFVFTQKADPTKWEYLKLLAMNLDAMEDKFVEVPRPFIYGIQKDGKLRKIA